MLVCRLEWGAPGQGSNQRDGYNGSEECNHDATDIDAVHSVRNSEKLSSQKAADYTTDDTHDDISAGVSTATSHHLVGKPTGNQTYYNPRYDTHVTISFLLLV
jgi:hypothetical protein